MAPITLESKDSVFIMIDIQEKVIPAVAGGEKIVTRAERLARSAQVLEVPLIVTEQYPKGLGRTIAPLQPYVSDESVVEKSGFSCFDSERFGVTLDKTGRKTAVIFGVESHICVFITAMEFKRRGFQTIVAEEACGSRDPAHHRLAMENLLSADIAVLPVETIVYQLLKRAGAPAFKTLLPLFK